MGGFSVMRQKARFPGFAASEMHHWRYLLVFVDLLIVGNFFFFQNLLIDGDLL